MAISINRIFPKPCIAMIYLPPYLGYALNLSVINSLPRIFDTPTLTDDFDLHFANFFTTLWEQRCYDFPSPAFVIRVPLFSVLHFYDLPSSVYVTKPEPRSASPLTPTPTPNTRHHDNTRRSIVPSKTIKKGTRVINRSEGRFGQCMKVINKLGGSMDTIFSYDILYIGFLYRSYFEQLRTWSRRFSRLA